MLDPEISARQAKALLSTHDHDSRDGTIEGLNRRRFLQLAAAGVGGAAALSGVGSSVLPNWLPGDGGEAFAAGPLAANEGVLVLIGMYGGNDCLNTVVPYSNPRYVQYRSNIAIATDQLHILDNDYGLHPNLAYLKALYDQQLVAVVHGLGYPNPDLSHFNSMATWMSARVGGPPTSGWIGRWLDGIGDRADLYTAATIGSSLPLHLIGESKRGTAVPEDGFQFGGETKPEYARMYSGIRVFSASSAGRGPWHDALAAASGSQISLAQKVSPLFSSDIPGDNLVHSLTVAARLINADIGLRVLDTSLGDFDHHANEPFEHAQRMQELNDGIQAFFATLNPVFANRVTLMTFSEFGRTPWSNDSSGTDHGTSGTHFVIGGNVKGGMYGQAASLSTPTGAAIDRWGRMTATMDFRSLYSTMIDGVLGGGASTVLGGEFPAINLFRPPGAATTGFPGSNVVPSTGPGVPTSPARFVGMTPARLADTRTGAGLPIGPGATLDVHVGGAKGVPGEAVAAVLNVTAVGGTTSSYLTVWPSDVARPSTSSLNTLGGDVVPNLVISKLSSSGNIGIFNFSGQTHCVVDVVGYFVNGNGSGLTPVSPARILDTRSGVGAPAAAVPQSASINLQVTGVGGVASDADSVVMNVTVTEPTAAGFLTVWPSGAAMPTASNLNFVANQTVPNLVVAKLGPAGNVAIFNSAGSTHVIADVLGYFSSAGTSMVAIPPSRLLDTRTDNGASAPVAQTPLKLPVVNRGGVPAGGVSAVVLNVTATQASVNGFVTVYPNGESRPLASNLNTVAGQTRANLVIAKVGAEGSVAMFNGSGSVHLIADVVGYFTA